MSSAKTELVKDYIEDDGDGEDDVPTAISSRKKSALSGSTKKALLQSNAKRMEKEQPGELGNEEEEVKEEEDEEEKNKSKKKKKTVNKKEETNEQEKEREKEPTVKKEVQNKKRIWKNDKRVSGEYENTENVEVKKKAKERKVYALPGQKHDTPEERDALRIFYETLYQQVPTSEMAKIWMMEWGLLPSEEAAIVYMMKLKKSQMKSPFKSVSKITDEVSMVKSKKEITVKTETKMMKKRKTGFEGSDDNRGDDFIAPRKKIKRGK